MRFFGYLFIFFPFPDANCGLFSAIFWLFLAQKLINSTKFALDKYLGNVLKNRTNKIQIRQGPPVVKGKSIKPKMWPFLMMFE